MTPEKESAIFQDGRDVKAMDINKDQTRRIHLGNRQCSVLRDDWQENDDRQHSNGNNTQMIPEAFNEIFHPDIQHWIAPRQKYHLFISK